MKNYNKNKLYDNNIDLSNYKYLTGLISYTVVNHEDNSSSNYFSCGIIVSDHCLIVPLDHSVNNQEKNTITNIEFISINNHIIKNKTNIVLPNKISIMDYHLFNIEKDDNEINKITCWGLILCDMPIGILLQELKKDDIICYNRKSTLQSPYLELNYLNNKINDFGNRLGYNIKLKI